MQFQADVLQRPVEVALEREMTALGAAALALGVEPEARGYQRYEPRIPAEEAERLYAGWRDALRRAL
jgi:glycerol kinase